MRTRVLVLQEKQENIKNIAESLPDCTIVNVQTVHQANVALRTQPIDMIVSAVHLEYDESVFDFLESCKTSPHTKDIPFVFYCSRSSTFARSVRHGLEIAAEALGADHYITMESYEQDRLRTELLKVLIKSALKSEQRDIPNAGKTFA